MDLDTELSLKGELKMTISLDSNARMASKDEILFKEGDEASKIFLVKEGSVLCVKKSKERLIPIFEAGPQKIIGEEAVLAKQPYGYSAIVMESAEIVEVDGNLISSTLEEAPYWLGALMATLGERLIGTSEAIAEHRISSPELTGGEDLSPQEENRIKKILAGT